MLTKSFRNNIPLLSLLIIFCIDLLLILTTHLNWNSAMSKYLPLKSQIQTFKSDISEGHLWFEEAVSGDKTINIEDDVMKKFRQEKLNLYIESAKDSLSSKEDMNYYKKIFRIHEKSKLFYALSKKRWENVLKHGIGSELDQEFDKKYNELIALSNSLNEDIDNRLSLEFENRNKYFNYILTLFFILNLIIFIVLYISKKKKIEFEEKLFKEKEKAQIMLNSIGDAVIATDNKGFVEFLNPIAQTLTGFSLKEAKGQELDIVFNIFNSSTKEKVESPVQKVLKEGKIVGLANGTALKSKNGDVYIIEDSAAPIKDKEGNILGTILVFYDVTEKTKVKEQLKLNEKMLMQQSKLASMGEMLENIAHQWRQPLSAITTAASGMKVEKEFNVLSDKEFEKNIDAIINNSNRLSKTIDNFRDFFKPNNEKILLDLNETINNAISIVSSKLEIENIKVEKECSNIRMHGFSSELLQIFVTLFSNSIEAFTEDIKDKTIFIKTQEENKSIYITVRDNAGGVEESIIYRLFEPYFTTKHQSQGKGIGLFMIEEIISKHMNGKIFLKNYIYEKGNKGLEILIILDTKEE